MRNLIIFGAGGHAKVIADIAMKNGYEIAGFLDDNDAISEVIGFKRLGKISDCVKYKDTHDFAIGIGNNSVRKNIFEKYSDLNYVTLIHPTASIGLNTEIKRGTVVMSMTVVNACATVGEFCVINSGAVVEHDCVVGDFTLLAPNSTLCGCVKVGNEVWMGAGSSVNPVVKICDNVTVGSGAVVTKDITEPGTYVGVPIKKI